MLPPGDLILLSGAFDASTEVDVVDALAEGMTLSELVMRVDPGRYDGVVVQSSSGSWPEDRAVLRWLAGRVPALILNGDHGLKHATEVLHDRTLGVDAIVKDMLAADLAALIGGASGPVAGLVRRVGDEIVMPPACEPAPRTPRHDLFPLSRYSLPYGVRRPVTTVYTAMGCPWDCGFCLAGSEPVAFREVDEVLQELVDLRRIGVREVVFFDPLFTSSRGRVRRLCEGMRQRRIGLSWSCFARIDTVPDEVLEELRSAGCHTLLLGLESGSDRVLESMQKRQRTADVRRAIASIRDHGLRAGGFFVLGYPGETDAEIEATIRFACELDLAFASFQLVVPFDGTPMGESLRQEGIIESSVAGYDDSERPFSAEPSRSVEQLLALRDRAYRRFYLRPRYVFRRASDVRSLSEFRALAREGIGLLSDVPSAVLQRRGA